MSKTLITQVTVLGAGDNLVDGENVTRVELEVEDGVQQIRISQPEGMDEGAVAFSTESWGDIRDAIEKLIESSED